MLTRFLGLGILWFLMLVGSVGGTVILEQNFDGFSVGAVAAGIGKADNQGGRWCDIGALRDDPSVTSEVCYSKDKSLRITRGPMGTQVVGWTTTTMVPSGVVFDFTCYACPKKLNDGEQGSWTAHVNNYNFIHDKAPVSWYVDGRGNLKVWQKDRWKDTGKDVPAEKWTGIRLSVKVWNNGTGTGLYDVYVDYGSGFEPATSNVEFSSSELFTNVNAVVFSPSTPPEDGVNGHVDNVSITTAAKVASWRETVDAILAKQYKELKPLLKISWKEGPEYPMGIQEPACGILRGKFISAGGFTRNPKNITALYPDAFGGERSGFTNLTFSFDPQQPHPGWVHIAEIPGIARQGGISAVVDECLYIVGGFNYTEPLTYKDGYRLRYQKDKWVWEKLPIDFPWPVYAAGAAVVGKKIYLIGGADFFKASGAKDADFHSEAGRNNNPVGQAVFVLDTENLEAGWKRLADFPGTPRFDSATAAVNGKIYVFTGIYAPLKKTMSSLYHNVVDSWVYDTEKNMWTRLKDLPHGANRRAVVFKNRYIIMVGGYKYPKTRNFDGSVNLEVYTLEEKTLEWKDFFEKTVLVYDTKTDRLGMADFLLEQTSWPGVGIQDDTIFSLGGEGGMKLWHPDTFQIGKITEIKP